MRHRKRPPNLASCRYRIGRLNERVEMMATKAESEQKARQQAGAADRLRELLTRSTPRAGYGRPVMYVKCDHVAKSGMSRSIVPFLVVDGELLDVSYWVSDAVGWPMHRIGDGVKVDGCGMDMGFYLVYTLARTLYFETRPAWGQVDESPGYDIAHRWA